MEKAIEVLMGEHRVIERVLASLESYARQVETGRRLERAQATDFATFFKSYADACHHGKEEDLLFRRMIDFGFPSDHGPIAVMLHEHVVGREQVGAIRTIGEAQGPTTEAEQAAFLRCSFNYVPMLRGHIRKEDDILYPLAVQVIPAPELDRLAEQYEEFQAKVVGAGAYEEMQRLAERLTSAHPFDPAVLQAGPALGCGAPSR